jgi:hypothetical protein
MAAFKTTRGGTWLLTAALLLAGLYASTAETSANSAVGEAHVLEVCWYPRASTGAPAFFITSRIRQAKKVIFFFHKRPQRGLHQGGNWSTNYAVSWTAYKRAMHQPPHVPGIGKLSLHVTLRSNQHFVYAIEPWTCNLG